MQATNQPQTTGAKLRRRSEGRQLIGAIDQGTSSTRFLVFENGTGRLVASSQVEVQRIVPKEGWVEFDPIAIMDSVYSTIETVHKQLESRRSSRRGQQKSNSSLRESLKCIGICNQRESTVVWDSVTGKPLYNVIVWMDNRTKDLVDQMIDSTPGRDFNWLKDKTGLPMSTYFSAFKLKWLMDNVQAVKDAVKERRLLFGTVDSWILWNLTGKHLTDVTNASRTFLMDIETLEWDKALCKQFNVPQHILPKILSSADDFGLIQHGPLKGLPITGVIGDQSAALFGHNCLKLGQTKATFGTGCFIMQNIGPGPLHGALKGVQREAKRGLITTVGYKLRGRPASYALEGSIKIAGAALTWLRDNMQLIKNYEECDHLVNQTTNSAGVFFVPALGGLYSPYWDPNAAGLFIGLSQFSRREHLIRATFDSIAFQTNDILSLMRGVTHGLMIDGGLCKSDNMCQILADVTGCDIVRPSMCETSALGAAMVAGCGADIWSYESMIANSNNPFDYTSTTNQNHHYPPESLHYQDKFSSLIHSKRLSAGSITEQSNFLESNKEQPINNLVVGVDDDAGGGGSSSSSREQIVHQNLLTTMEHDDDSDSQLSDSEYGDELNGVISTSGEFSSTEQSNSDNLITSKDSTDRVVTVLHYDPALSSLYQTASSGYCSGDNFDKLTTSNSGGSCRGIEDTRDSPIGAHNQMHSDSPNMLELAASPSADEVVAAQNSQQTFLDICIDRRDHVCPHKGSQLPGAEFEDDDLYEDQYEDEDPISSSSSDQEQISPVESPSNDQVHITRKASSTSRKQSLADTSDRPPAKKVDFFQSYISLEHRTELVGTWKLAVERSMQWTKIQHEEIRKIDYLRLSSLPISMYLFFSIGMVALSGVMSATKGFSLKF